MEKLELTWVTLKKQAWRTKEEFHIMKFAVRKFITQNEGPTKVWACYILYGDEEWAYLVVCLDLDSL